MSLLRTLCFWLCYLVYFMTFTVLHNLELFSHKAKSSSCSTQCPRKEHFEIDPLTITFLLDSGTEENTSKMTSTADNAVSLNRP